MEGSEMEKDKAEKPEIETAAVHQAASDENSVPVRDKVEASLEIREKADEDSTKEASKPEKKKKPKKIKKAPGFYKKFIKAEKAVILEKKYIKYIEVPADKDFVRSCYQKQDDGLHIRADLYADDVKRLKILAGAIKKNRKAAVNFLPLAVTAIFVAGLIVFFTIFANPLLERALEMGLEAVFEAKTDADRLRLSVLKFEITLDGLTIADRDSPMKNLIQFSSMVVRLKPNAVLRGKVYIEEIRADSIRFGTPRTVSGALPDKPPKVKKAGGEIEVPPLINLENFDATALLNQEFDKLKTPKIYEEAKSAFDTASAKWKSEADSAKARVAELEAQARPLLAINVNDYSTLDVETVERIRTTINDIQTLSNTVEESVDDVNGIVGGARADFSAASGLLQNVQNYVTEDFNHLKSYVDISSGAAMGVIEPIVRSILTDTAETYLGYGNRALEVLEKVKALQAQLPKSEPKTKAEKYRGRDVIFPAVTYPRFFLGLLSSDVLTPGNWHWGFDLRGVSSDPDLSEVPTTLALSLEEAGDKLQRTAAFNGTADFRSGAKERFNADLSGGGFPMSMNARLSQIGIGGFGGNASFDIGLSGMADGSFTGAGDISLAGAEIKNPSNTVVQAVSRALTEVNSLDLGLLYEHISSSRDNFSVSTNIGDILAAALKEIVDEYKEIAFKELERVLNERLASYIDGVNISRTDMETLVKIVQGDKAAIDGLENTLNSKKNEFEQKLKSAADEAIDQVKDEAKAQAEQAVRDLQQGKTPEAPTLPSVNIPNTGLPSLPFKR